MTASRDGFTAQHTPASAPKSVRVQGERMTGKELLAATATPMGLEWAWMEAHKIEKETGIVICSIGQKYPQAANSGWPDWKRAAKDIDAAK